MSVRKILTNEPWAITENGWVLLSTIVAAHEQGNVTALLPDGHDTLVYTRAVKMVGKTAVIPVDGPLFAKANLFTHMSGATAYASLIADIRKADASDGVEKIILAFNSPGGTVVGVEEASAAIKATKKPILAHVDGVAASAAYRLAVATDGIYASPMSAVGSIGVIATVAKDASEELTFVSSASPNKRLDPESDAGKASIQARVDALGEIFVADVAAARGVSVEKVKTEFGKGDIVTASTALSVGMIDGISTLSDLTQETQMDEKLLTSLGLPATATAEEAAAQIAALKNKVETSASAAENLDKQMRQLAHDKNLFLCERLANGEDSSLLPAQVAPAAALLDMAYDNPAMHKALVEFYSSLEQDTDFGEVLSAPSAPITGQGDTDATEQQITARLGG